MIVRIYQSLIYHIVASTKCNRLHQVNDHTVFLLGNEIFGPVNVGLRTNISIEHITLVSGTRYYTTVYAFNALDMPTFDTSDGFLFDSEPPIPGTVYTNLNYKDRSHHSFVLKASWTGFLDRHSYIKEYLFAIAKVGDEPKFVSAVLQNYIEEDVSDLYDGEKYRVHVKAIDAAGHQSAVSVSDIIIIDRTAPKLLSCNSFVSEYQSPLNCSSVIVSEFSPVINWQCFADEPLHMTKGNFYEARLFLLDDPNHAKSRIEIGSHTDWVYFRHVTRNMYQFNTRFVATDVREAIPFLLTPLFSSTYTVTLYRCESTLEVSDGILRDSVYQSGYFSVRIIHPFYDSESDVKSIQVGLGTNKGGFQLLPYQDFGPQSTSTYQIPLQHKMHVYATFSALNKVGIRTIISSEPLLIDWTSPKIDYLHAYITEAYPNLYWIGAAWNVTDEESTVTGCFWTIGIHATNK